VRLLSLGMMNATSVQPVVAFERISFRAIPYIAPCIWPGRQAKKECHKDTKFDKLNKKLINPSIVIEASLCCYSQFR